MTASDITLTLIGGPTVLIEFDGVRLLTDPTFDPPGLYQEAPVRFEKTSGPTLSVEEIGGILGIAPRSVKRDWALARIWLYEQLRVNAKPEEDQRS